MHIQAFRGLRYDLGHVGSLSEVVAPPHDAIDDEIRDALYERHPANAVRLIVNRVEPGDDQSSDRYQRAARFLKNWRSQGVLTQEADPAIYVYHQSYDWQGQRHTQRSFISRVRLSPLGEGPVVRCQQPSKSKSPADPSELIDGLQFLRACQANLHNVVGLYPDRTNAAQGILETAIIGKTPLEATDPAGVTHRVWPITDIHVIARLAAEMDNRTTFLAEGDIYEAAVRYSEERKDGDGNAPVPESTSHVMMTCISMSDPGTRLVPVPVLMRAKAVGLDCEQLRAKLGECFDCRIAGEGADLAEVVWQQLEQSADGSQLALYTPSDSRWVIARATDAGRMRLQEVAGEHSEQWRDLGASWLHRLLIEVLLADLGPSEIEPVAGGIDALIDRLNQQDEGSSAVLAAFHLPPTLDDVRALGEAGELLPAASVRVSPQPISGLVLSPLD